MLVVDLDGTLIRSDMLQETALRLLKLSPISFFKIPIWLLQGKASLKRKLVERVDFDPSKLPYNEKIIGWLQDQKNSADH